MKVSIVVFIVATKALCSKGANEPDIQSLKFSV